MLCGDGLGMELYAEQREFLMAQCHENAAPVVRGGFELWRKAFSVNDQGVITRRFESVFDVFKNIAAVVLDDINLSVHGLRPADNLCTKRLRNDLVSEAYAEEGEASVAFPHEIETNTRVVGVFGARREDDRPGFECKRFFGAQGIIAFDVCFEPDVTEEMDEVVGKTVVVVDKKNHGTRARVVNG